jgi:hypothetical protein
MRGFSEPRLLVDVGGEMIEEPQLFRRNVEVDAHDAPMPDRAVTAAAVT